MTLKFIQINIFKGKYLEELISFIKAQDPDFITMQEVSAGVINLCKDKQANLFEVLEKNLGLDGAFHSDTKIVGQPDAKFGNAVFSKWPVLDSKVVPLKTFRAVTLSEFSKNINNIWAQVARHMLDTIIDVEGKKIHIISVHGRRIAPPTDDQENIRQARLIAGYLKKLRGEAFIMGGDFNMPLGSEVIGIISDVSDNLLEGSGVLQTLNPKVHELGEKGYSVDLVFASKHFKKISVAVPQITVSDHLPVIASLEYKG